MKFSGKLVSGFGEGSFYVSKYAELFRGKLGFLPFAGTLNVLVETIPQLEGAIIVEPGGNLKPVDCYQATVSARGKSVDCFLVRPKATRHPENIVEFVAPVNIRQVLWIKDGDSLECSV